MFGAERSQYRDDGGERGTGGSCLKKSGQGPCVGQRRYSRWREALDKTVNGCGFGRRCSHLRAGLGRRRSTPPEGGKGGSVCPGTGTVVRVVGHRRLLYVVAVFFRRDGCRQTRLRMSERSIRTITISTLGLLFSPPTTMHSDAFDVIPFEVLRECSEICSA